MKNDINCHKAVKAQSWNLALEKKKIEKYILGSLIINRPLQFFHVIEVYIQSYTLSYFQSNFTHCQLNSLTPGGDICKFSKMQWTSCAT